LKNIYFTVALWPFWRRPRACFFEKYLLYGRFMADLAPLAGWFFFNVFTLRPLYGPFGAAGGLVFLNVFTLGLFSIWFGAVFTLFF
jgi:hypothetical protein